MRMKCYRKSIPKITERALKKCERFYKNGLYAYCTPVEYVALCWYFCIEPDDFYKSMVSRGENSQSHHYFRVKKFDREFPVSKYAMLDVVMEKR
jgi:hypothetical protein